MKGGRELLIGLLFCVLILSSCNLPDRVAERPTTSIAPVAVLMAQSACRSGAGESFNVVDELKPGQNAEIAGRTPDGTYILVRDPANPAALCWVNSAAAQVVGDLSGLPAFEVPPAATIVSGCPSPVGGGPTLVDCTGSVSVGGCPSPVGGGPTPVDCSAAVGSGCPSPVGGGPTPVVCSGAGASVPAYVCPSPIGGGPTPVNCSAAFGSGCPSPIGGGPTPVVCSGSGSSGYVYGCPSPIGGGPTPVDCSGPGGAPQVYGCPSPIGGGPTPVDCSGSSAPSPLIAPPLRIYTQPTPIQAPAPLINPLFLAAPTAVQ